MPLLVEEQVLMCRLLLDRLRPGDLVLDVGTGSGVFGIWAAKKRKCRVVGIDVSKRALKFTAANAKKNGVRIVKQLEKIGKGEIFLIHCSFEDFVRKHGAFGQQFDIVFLNPPFNPTCPVIKPALHADAGPYAQRPFKSQIKLVPKVQKVSGYCLGYQMSYDVREGEIQAIDLIRNAYRDKCRITYANVLNDEKSINAEHFLVSQYSSFLAHDNDVSTIVKRYIKKVGGKGQCFSLIYYEVSKENSVVLEPPIEVSICALPPKTWQDRIWLHKCIVDHSSLMPR